MAIRTIVVDDMELARNRLVRYLARHPDVEVIAECGDGTTAIETVRSLAPDLVFLDVQMPECDGFEVARSLGEERVPEIVFVTAFDEFAIKAFEVHAVDYLLKPFSDERLEKTLDTVRRRLQQPRAPQGAPHLSDFLRALHPLAKRQRSIIVKANGRSVVLHQNEIDWVEASGNYLKIHAGKESHLIRETMAQFEDRLAPEIFVRIHRSTIVNVSRVRELHPLFNGDQELVLRDGQRLTMSRTFRQRLMEMLGEF
jgi:two-component system, LytTR family, response regulator